MVLKLEFIWIKVLLEISLRLDQCKQKRICSIASVGSAIIEKKMQSFLPSYLVKQVAKIALVETQVICRDISHMDKCTIDLFSFTTLLSNHKNYKNYTVTRLMWPLQIFLLLIFLSFFVEVSPAHRLETINIHTIQIHMSSTSPINWGFIIVVKLLV